MNKQSITWEKIDTFLYQYFICKDCTKKEVHMVIFFNPDDNVCVHCGSKNCYRLHQAKLKAEVENL